MNIASLKLTAPMTTEPTATKKTTESANEPPLISRNTIIILLSYQTGMILGNGIPSSIANIVFLAVSVAVVAYLAFALIRDEGRKKKVTQKHKRTARQVDRRIRTHIVDSPVTDEKAAMQPKLRKTADFVPVVSEWA